MVDDEDRVALHYARAGLMQAILEALIVSGIDIERLVPSDLSAVDEFHLGWHEATRALARDLGLAPDMEVLDLGAGLGGPARSFAAHHGCRVVGIDLTPDFVATATALTRRCGLAHLVAFDLGNVLDLPYADGRFDRASLIHVGMNVADKARLFAEARRVLKPGALLGVYDVMRLGREALPYPMPWAETPDASYIKTPADYRTLLMQAGFAIDAEHDRSDQTLTLARQMRAEAEIHGPPPLGLHLVMGPAAGARLANVMDALDRGVIAPIAMVGRAV